MGSDVVEIEFYEKINELSEKIKTSAFIAYVNLHGVFQGVTRVTGEEITSIFKEMVGKSRGRCLYNRISFKKNGAWDEVVIIICNGLVIASHGEIDDEENLGEELLKKIIKNINENLYTRGIIETIELPEKLVKEQLNIDIEEISRKEEVIEEEKPELSLKAEEKAPEIEEVIEKGLETAATIPVETSISKTEMLPGEEKREVPPEVASALGLPPQPKPTIEAEEKITKKPMVIEEISRLDKPLMDLSDRLIELSSSENINISNAVVQGDPDRLDLEVTITRLGWGRKREKMLKLANSIADILSSILLKNRASQKELIITVRHGYDAVRITRRLKH